MDKIKRWDVESQDGRDCNVMAREDGDYVLHSDHEQVVAELAKVREQYQKMCNSRNNEITCLRAEADSLRKDAQRWQYVRTILAVEHIEAAYEMCGHPSHVPNEKESERADQAIDIAMGARA